MSKLQTRSNDLLRAADHHNVLSAIHEAKPKPTKEGRKPKSKSIIGVCPSCGEISPKTDPYHGANCAEEFPVIYHTKKKTELQLIKEALDVVTRAIVFWRDGAQCVLKGLDGVHCGGIETWGHVVAQGQSGHLVYSLSNSAVQCQFHNGAHRFDQYIYHKWYRLQFGYDAFEFLYAEKEAHRICEYNITDYKEMLYTYNDMYQNRYGVPLEFSSLIANNYYGDIIRKAWKR